MYLYKNEEQAAILKTLIFFFSYTGNAKDIIITLFFKTHTSALNKGNIKINPLKM